MDRVRTLLGDRPWRWALVVVLGANDVTTTSCHASADPRFADDTRTPAALHAAAISDFFQKQDMAAAEKGFKAAMDHLAATADEKREAHFYWAAALGRQNKYDEAIKAQQAWLTSYPDDKLRNYVLLFQGIYHAALGHDAEAK